MPNPTKGSHYIQELDQARCDGNWEAVPELVRKVRKHAPERHCLALTAETEHAIATATANAGAAPRPSTAVPSKDIDASGTLPRLLEAIEKEDKHPEDKFQAQVCVGWLHWVVAEYSLALVRLPKSLDQENAQFENAENLSEWTRVCALKSAYLKANCLARQSERTEALIVFETSLPSLAPVWSNKAGSKQLRYWSELFLTEYCMLSSQAFEEKERELTDPNSLAAYRSWAKYWESSRGVPLAGGYGFRGAVPRRRIWYEYYAAVSEIMLEDLPFPTGYAPVNNESSARNQLRIELKKVEASYEALLLSETTFPKAEEERQEVEAFVEMVMSNWTIINGPSWREQDLGQGGRQSLNSGVLDILFRAATKTFHSTAILRHLFTVHLAIAEFDLAFKAFDTYFEVLKKGKARVEKTGHPEPSLDDDETMLETVCSCIAALCRYGNRQSAEKARDLSIELESILQKLQTAYEDGIAPVKEHGPLEPSAVPPQDKVSPSVLGLAWQSIGLAQAQWARTTYDASSRSEIQRKAIRALRKSLSAEYGRTADLRGLFALALLLAEQRELAAAIDLVKTSLMATKSPADQEPHNAPYWRERALIPLWHLLSLMLSTRSGKQDYVMAARACEGAFEQFKDPAVLFGSKALNGSYRSDHLNEAEAAAQRGLVDDMDDYERESILEVKMTQLAIVEILEGPKVAVNASLELLSLYSRLFGTPPQKPGLNPAKTSDIPKSSGTTRSFRGSIFGSRSEKSSRTRQSVIGTEKMATIQSRPQTAASATTAAPTIQITNENGSAHEGSRPTRRSASTAARSESGKRTHNSLRKRDSSGSRRRAVSSGGLPTQPTVLDGESYFTPAAGEEGTPTHDFFTFASKRVSSIGSPGFPPSKALPHTDSYASSKSRASVADLTGVTVDGIESSSTLLPVIQFSKEHQTRWRSAVLIKVWLMVAGLYRRAEMFDDAQGAVNEAMKLIQALEAEVAKDTSGSLSLREAGWGGNKSVEELWGDLWAEKGYLSLAKDAPYQARSDFESALTHSIDHPAAIIGLSSILLDIYEEKLLPPPAVPRLTLVGGGSVVPGASTILNSIEDLAVGAEKEPEPSLPHEPLGLGTKKKPAAKKDRDQLNGTNGTNGIGRLPGSLPPAVPLYRSDPLQPPYKATSLPLVDRLAARDRAYGLLSSLTKLGAGWNNAEAWFALARAQEESGQPDKAKEALWWVVELEEGTGVREWANVGAGGYVL